MKRILFLVLLASCSPVTVARIDFTCLAARGEGDQAMLYCADEKTWREFDEKKRREGRNF